MNTCSSRISPCIIHVFSTNCAFHDSREYLRETLIRIIYILFPLKSTVIPRALGGKTVRTKRVEIPSPGNARIDMQNWISTGRRLAYVIKASRDWSTRTERTAGGKPSRGSVAGDANIRRAIAARYSWLYRHHLHCQETMIMLETQCPELSM